MSSVMYDMSSVMYDLSSVMYDLSYLMKFCLLLAQLASVFSDALEYQSSLPFALTNVTTEILPTLLAIDRLIISCIQGSFICSNRLIDSNNKRSLIDYHGMSLILDSTSVP